MKSRTLSIIAVLLPIAALLMGGCGGGGGNTSPSQSGQSNTTNTGTRQYKSLQITTSAPAEVQKGQGYPVTLLVKNTGTNDTVLTFTQFIRTDALITKDGYAFSQSETALSPKLIHSGVIPQALPITLRPGESRTVASAVSFWNDDQYASVSAPVAPGTYTAQVWLQAYNIDGTPLNPDEQKANLASSPMQVTVR